MLRSSAETLRRIHALGHVLLGEASSAAPTPRRALETSNAPTRVRYFDIYKMKMKAQASAIEMATWRSVRCRYVE